MRFAIVLVLTTGVWLGTAGESKAQSSLFYGPTGYGSSASMAPLPYANSYGNWGMMGGPTYYGTGYLTSPGTFSYSAGYRGFAPPTSLYNGYSYGNYSGVPRAGFHPFRAWKRYY